MTMQPDLDPGAFRMRSFVVLAFLFLLPPASVHQHNGGGTNNGGRGNLWGRSAPKFLVSEPWRDREVSFSITLGAVIGRPIGSNNR